MTRTFKHLYPKIYDWDNLYAAWKRACKGGKRKWPTVAAFEVDLESNLWALHHELRDRSYRPGPYRHFMIATPKLRCISASAAPQGNSRPRPRSSRLRPAKEVWPRLSPYGVRCSPTVPERSGGASS